MTRNGNNPQQDDDASDDDWDFDVDDVGNTNSDSNSLSSRLLPTLTAPSRFTLSLLFIFSVSLVVGVAVNPFLGIGVASAGVIGAILVKQLSRKFRSMQTAATSKTKTEPEQVDETEQSTATDGGSQQQNETETTITESATTKSGISQREWPYVPKTLDGIEYVRTDRGKQELLAQDPETEDVYAGKWPRQMFEHAQQNPDQPIYIGHAENRVGIHREVPLDKSSLDKHGAIFGATGMGKSTLIKIILGQIAMAGGGFCYIDPKKGDDIFELLQILPEDRLDDVVWIEPAARGRDRVVGLNFLEPPVEPGEPGYEEAIEATVDNLVGILRAGDYWGARMDRIARNIIRAMSQSDTNYTLVDMYYILRDDERRDKFADAVANEGMDFIYEYTQEIAEMDADNLEPLLGRMQPWVENSITREIIAHDESTIDLTEAMMNDKIILVKNTVSSGDVKKAISTGLIRQFWTAAQERAELTDEDERDLYYLAVDEADDVLTPEMQVDKILTKARSYKLSFILMSQYPSQISDTNKQALFANVRTILAMSVTEESDARTIMNRFEDKDKTDLINLDKFKAWTKIVVDGTQSKPFVTNTFADYPPLHSKKNAEQAIQASLKKFGVSRKTDEDIFDSLNIPGETTADHESEEKQKQIIARAVAIAAASVERSDDYAPVSLVKEVNSHLQNFGEYDFSQVIENNPDIFQTKRDGEMHVTLTDQGGNLARTQDSGSSGSSGKEDHRYLLRRTREEFAKLGIAVAVPEQGGDEAEVDGVGHIFTDTHSVLTHGHNTDEPLYIEAESTTTSSPFQTLRNLRKALVDDVKCVFVVKEPEDKDLEHYARKIETIITERRGYRQHKNNGQKKLLYTTNTYLKESKGGTAWPVRRRQNQKQGDLETRWWIEDGELVLRDINGIEYTRFANVDDYPSHSIHDFPAYIKEDGGIFRVYQDGEQIASYESQSEMKEEWVRIKQPFIPDLEFPRPPDRSDYEVVIIPDNEEPALRYKNGETSPLIDAEPKTRETPSKDENSEENPTHGDESNHETQTTDEKQSPDDTNDENLSDTNPNNDFADFFSE